MSSNDYYQNPREHPANPKVVPDLFGIGNDTTGYRGVQGAVHNIVGFVDRRRNAILEILTSTYNSGADTGTITGYAFCAGDLIEFSAGNGNNTFSGAENYYVFAKSDGTLDTSVNMYDVDGSLIGQCVSNAVTPMYNERKLDTEYMQIVNEIIVHQAPKTYYSTAHTLDVSGNLVVDSSGQINLQTESTNRVTVADALVDVTVDFSVATDKFVITAATGATAIAGNVTVSASILGATDGLAVGDATNNFNFHANSVTTYGNIIPATDGNDNVGTDANTFASMVATNMYATNFRVGTTASSVALGAAGTSNATAGASKVGVYATSLHHSASTDVMGALVDIDAILYGLHTTIGLTDLTAAEVNQLEKIGTVDITNAQWAYLGNMNQDVTTTSNATFANLTSTGNTVLGNGTADDSLEINAYHTKDILHNESAALELGTGSKRFNIYADTLSTAGLATVGAGISLTGGIDLQAASSINFKSDEACDVNMSYNMGSGEWSGLTITLANITTDLPAGKAVTSAGAEASASSSGDFLGILVDYDDKKVLTFGVVYNGVATGAGEIIYLGTSGSLTTNSSGLTYVTPVGISIDSNRVFISPSFVVVT